MAQSAGVFFLISQSVKFYCTAKAIIILQGHSALKKACINKTVIVRTGYGEVTHAVMTSHLDYCNTISLGRPLPSDWKHHSVPNVAVRLLMGADDQDPVAPLMRELNNLGSKFLKDLVSLPIWTFVTIYWRVSPPHPVNMWYTFVWDVEKNFLCGCTQIMILSFGKYIWFLLSEHFATSLRPLLYLVLVYEIILFIPVGVKCKAHGP